METLATNDFHCDSKNKYSVAIKALMPGLIQTDGCKNLVWTLLNVDASSSEALVMSPSTRPASGDELTIS